MTLGDFTPQADAYARARPPYPERLVEALVAHSGVKPRDSVADFGAGTGILSAQLAARGLQITAIEPNAPMRELARPTEGVTWLDGTFESSGLDERIEAVSV